MTKEKANRNEVVGMFLTYCRKTLVNARTDVLRERKRRRNREVLFCDLRRSELESLADWQDVPERETVFDAAGKPIGVTDKDLADALEKLCPEEQAIILLSYFAGWSDRRIGEDMGFPRSTVQNRRARALGTETREGLGEMSFHESCQRQHFRGSYDTLPSAAVQTNLKHKCATSAV